MLGIHTSLSIILLFGAVINAAPTINLKTRDIAPLVHQGTPHPSPSDSLTLPRISNEHDLGNPDDDKPPSHIKRAPPAPAALRKTSAQAAVASKPKPAVNAPIIRPKPAGPGGIGAKPPVKPVAGSAASPPSVAAVQKPGTNKASCAGRKKAGKTPIAPARKTVKRAAEIFSSIDELGVDDGRGVKVFRQLSLIKTSSTTAVYRVGRGEAFAKMELRRGQLRQEAQMTGKVGQLLAAGVDVCTGDFWMVVQGVRGGSLEDPRSPAGQIIATLQSAIVREFKASGNDRRDPRVLGLKQQLARVLSRCHDLVMNEATRINQRTGVSHNDLHPGNMMFITGPPDKISGVTLIDWGLATVRPLNVPAAESQVRSALDPLLNFGV